MLVHVFCTNPEIHALRRTQITESILLSQSIRQVNQHAVCTDPHICATLIMQRNKWGSVMAVIRLLVELVRTQINDSKSMRSGKWQPQNTNLRLRQFRLPGTWVERLVLLNYT